MSLSLTPIDRTWEPSPIPFTSRLEKILTSWEETPYDEHLRQRGTGPGCGTSCVGFLTAVLDELYRNAEDTDYPKMPADTAMNNPAGARKGMRFFLDQFPNHERLRGRGIQPGDILVVGHAGPGHAMIVGPRPNTLWHAAGDRVHYTGLSLNARTELFAVFRLTDREAWI